jgi:hypothetical protein
MQEIRTSNLTRGYWPYVAHRGLGLIKRATCACDRQGDEGTPIDTVQAPLEAQADAAVDLPTVRCRLFRDAAPGLIGLALAPDSEPFCSYQT